MEEFITLWTREELKAYILLYCAYANFVETEAEKEYIKSKSLVLLYIFATR